MRAQLQVLAIFKMLKAVLPDFVLDFQSSGKDVEMGFVLEHGCINALDFLVFDSPGNIGIGLFVGEVYKIFIHQYSLGMSLNQTD